VKFAATTIKSGQRRTACAMGMAECTPNVRAM